MKSLKFLMKKFRFSRKRSFLLGLFILLFLGVSVGYAFLTTTLNITGAVNVASSRWDVHFENVQIKEGSVTATTTPTITDDTSISFAATLENPGEFYEFSVDVVNDGTYNAIIDSLEITPTLTEDESKFFQYEVKWDDGITVADNFPILAGNSKTMKVHFQYLMQEDDSLLPDEDKDFNCVVTINFIQDSTIYHPEQSVLRVRENYTAFWYYIYREKIVNIYFSDVIFPPEHIVQEWDVSENNDGNVMAYLVANQNNNNYYDLYLQGNGHLYANSDSNHLFYDFSKLEKIVHLEKLDTSNVTNMDYMFANIAYYSTNFHIKLNQFDTSSATSMSHMFEYAGYKCTSFTMDLGNQFDTSNVVNMSYMFWHAGHWSQDFTINLGDKFDTGNVTDMSHMFEGLSMEGQSPYFTLNLGEKFDTSKVTNMGSMFASCGSNSLNFTLNLGEKFDTSKVTNMGSMFSYVGDANNTLSLDLSTFNFTNVTSYSSIFSGLSASNTIYVKDISSRDWILNHSGNSNLTTSNVLVKS